MIYETGWKEAINQSGFVKHIYACKGGKCFVAVAHRGIGKLGFHVLPLGTNSVELLDEVTVPFKDNEDEIRAKVKDWYEATT